MKIIVFGSINMDLVAKSPRLPRPGETVSGSEFFTAPGGKGANQAVAAARLGVPTFMVGRVGGDSFGQELQASLQAAGVNTEGVLVEDSTSSGVAVIAVDDKGENSIIVIPGANGQVGESDVERLKQMLPGAGGLLLQLEIPLNAVVAAAKAARSAGVPVILDPAPAPTDLPPELYQLADIITPNETEAAMLTGLPVNDQETALAAAVALRQRGVGVAVVKLGALGVVCVTAEESFFIPAFPVDAVDTVAAGDAFNGAMAVALGSGLSLRVGVVWGAAAGALATTQLGAQPGLPTGAAMDAFLAEMGARGLV
ncbi:MAG: ribokinase [Oscillatoriaceae cyanobacterium]